MTTGTNAGAGAAAAGAAPGGEGLGDRLVAAIRSDFPTNPTDRRPVHTYGMGATGTFRPSPVAADYCVAEHFATEQVDVTVRFSNGSGDAGEDDARPDVHGLAVKFHLPSGAETDMIGMTLPVFFVRDAKEFLAFSRAGVPKPVPPESWWQRLLDDLRLRPHRPAPPPGGQSGTPGLMRYADRHRYARAGLAADATLYAPSSWCRAEYYGVNAFGVTGADGVRRWVRFQWEPALGVHPIGPGEAFSRQGLRNDLSHRLARGDVAFSLRMAIAEAGDAVADPTQQWHLWRRTVVMGTMRVSDLVADQERDCEKLSFNPTRLVPGIECSADETLAARRVAYEASCRIRGGAGCPVGFSVEGAP